MDKETHKTYKLWLNIPFAQLTCSDGRRLTFNVASGRDERLIHALRLCKRSGHEVEVILCR